MWVTESMISPQTGTQFQTILKVSGGERLGDYRSNGCEVQLDSVLAKNLTRLHQGRYTVNRIRAMLKIQTSLFSEHAPSALRIFAFYSQAPHLESMDVKLWNSPNWKTGVLLLVTSQSKLVEGLKEEPGFLSSSPWPSPSLGHWSPTKLSASRHPGEHTSYLLGMPHPWVPICATVSELWCHSISILLQVSYFVISFICCCQDMGKGENEYVGSLSKT